jgi:hypothetical protein
MGMTVLRGTSRYSARGLLLLRSLFTGLMELDVVGRCNRGNCVLEPGTKLATGAISESSGAPNLLRQSAQVSPR